MTGGPSLVLDVSRSQGHLTAGLSETGATVQSYETVPADWDEISAISSCILGLLEKSGELGGLAAGAGADLRKHGRLLYEKIFPADLKRRISALPSADLTLLIDEQLVFIPWEVLFDGQDLLCLRFNLGRCVKTRQPLQRAASKLPDTAWRMLVIADPKGDLPSAAREAARIRQELASSPAVTLTSKTKNVLKKYLSRNIHECDILHYAGHAEYDFTDPHNSGWLFADGKLTGRDFMGLGAAAPLPPVIFMNACRSALHTQQGRGDGKEQHLFGLANILLAAGARYVIGAMGRVPDGTALLMACHFYRHLAQGQPVGAAFREARRDVRAIAGEDDLSWAGYILYGVPAACIVNGNNGAGDRGLRAGGSVRPGRGRPRAVWYFLAIALLLAGWSVLVQFWYRERADSGIRQARQELAAGRQESAVRYYERALSQAPGRPEAALELAGVYSRSREHAKAAAVLERTLAVVKRSGKDTELRPLTYALASESFLLGDYRRTVDLLGSVLPGGTDEPARSVSWYELLAHASALADDHEGADNWYVQASRLSREHSLGPARLRIVLAQADNAWEAYVVSRMSPGPGGQHAVGSLPSVIRSYEEAGEEAVRQKDVLAQARVAEGLARVYRLQDDWGRAVPFYQKAIALWNSLPVLTWEEKARLLNAYLDLAGGYVQPGLNFTEALHSLDQFRKLAETFKAIPAEFAPSVHILERKFELFLSQLSGRGYKNSDLYKRASVIYDRFITIPYLDP